MPPAQVNPRPMGLVSEHVEGAGNIREVTDKLPIEVHKAKEGLDLLDLCWGQPFCNSVDLCQIHSCQGASETGNVSCPSAHGTPTDLRNGHSRGRIPAECLEQKMLYVYATVCTQGDFTLSRKWEESCLLILPKPYYI